MELKPLLQRWASSISEKLNQYPVGGIVLKDGNIASAEGLSEMVSNLQVFTQNSLFIGISDEGGEDSPFITSGISENVIASQKEIAESLGNTGAYSAGISLGSELKQFGFNVDFAPLADVSLKDGSIAEQKGFGKDAATNAELARNVVKGLTDQSIFAGVKYFPGYGDATQEGNGGQIISQRTRDDLKEEYAPYQEAIDAGAKFLMISHVSLPKIRGDKLRLLFRRRSLRILSEMSGAMTVLLLRIIWTNPVSIRNTRMQKRQ